MKLRDLINENKTVKLSDLSIGVHGIKRGGVLRLTVPNVVADGNSTEFLDNQYGSVDLEKWKKDITKKYNVRTVSVNNGRVTILEPKYTKDVQQSIANKGDVTWGFE